MWLINVHTFGLEFFHRSPPYGILSHTWDGKDEEVLFHDMADLGRAKLKEGWHKIQETCRLAHENSLTYAWIDTCCIDKSSSAELSEAINSMSNWYEVAKICFVHLSDLEPPTTPTSSTDFRQQLARCKWFTRGWTLQELLCPYDIQFFDQTWKLIGTKKSLETELSSISGVDAEALRYRGTIWYVPVGKRMSWAAHRVTTRQEDMAYCLLGLFNVHMPLLYGEGAAHAFRRLQDQIVTKQSVDLSIFAWTNGSNDDARGIFAYSPAEFVMCREITAPTTSRHGDVLVTGNCVELNEPKYNSLPLEKMSGGLWREEIHLDLNFLECSEMTQNQPMWVTVPLQREKGTRTYSRPHGNELKYYPARPWLYNMDPPKPKISIRKTYSYSEYSLMNFGWAYLRLDKSMHQVLRWLRSPGHSTPFQGSWKRESTVNGNGIGRHDLYRCPFKLHVPSTERFGRWCGPPGLVTFTVRIGSLDDPITLILIYANLFEWAESGQDRSECDRRVLLTHICPKTHPDHHKAMQSIQSSTLRGDKHEEELSLAFDYAFQYLRCSSTYGDVIPGTQGTFQKSLDLVGTDTSIIHRFFASGSLNQSSEDNVEARYWFEGITTSYKRVKQDGDETK